MKTCEKFMKDAMLGSNSPELEKHLAECSDCASCVRMLRFTEESPMRNPEVPPELDSAVLGYALLKTPSTRRHSVRFMVKFVWLPVAAAFMICFGLVYAFRPYSGERTAPIRVGISGGKSAAQYDMDNLDSEIFLLSSRIQETSVKIRNTAAYSAVYTQNTQNRIN